MYKNSSEKEDNFWVSYADLMAGLLFVFILLIALIVVKYIYTQNTLENSEDKNSELVLKLKTTQDLYSKSLEKIFQLENNLNIVLNELDTSSLIQLELDEEIQKVKEEKENLENILQDIVKLFIEIDEKQQKSLDEIIIKEQEILKLQNDFQIVKDKLNSLSGIKFELISKISQKLTNSIQIDKKSGAIKFSSNILFDKNSFTLKELSKKELKDVLKNYFDLLLKDEEINRYIENIIIEGYTDSDGSYLTNLFLSQRRALSVMQFLYEEKIVEAELLNSFVSSSGKSSSNLIYDENGVEDKDASRRIEIKFTIKNEAAIKELQNYLKRDLDENENKQ
ncbi:OmpA family protein [Aliarcobacter skirrowii]|jgi:chemotaxis protein MotB|uniref:OmpA family protein n=1 Tax=Aliarcobacter TaxID=2321111 RepID=UPI0008339B32|nr:OmpA family protein [Aliarcobacter skirrowii]MDX4034876.1 OmpA family protein [Aliarcobacter skirrowii]MDX4059918.1 OmpA family protein [Aliarcobacter skirrowii]